MPRARTWPVLRWSRRQADTGRVWRVASFIVHHRRRSRSLGGAKGAVKGSRSTCSPGTPPRAPGGGGSTDLCPENIPRAPPSVCEPHLQPMLVYPHRNLTAQVLSSPLDRWTQRAQRVSAICLKSHSRGGTRTRVFPLGGGPCSQTSRCRRQTRAGGWSCLDVLPLMTEHRDVPFSAKFYL